MESKTAVKRIVERYRAQGYDVIVQPRGKDLPRFADAFEPDLIATKGDQGVIVEIKRDRSDLEQDQSISRLAEVTNDQPGWRFDLIILEPESRYEEAAKNTAEPSVREIQQRLDEADKLSKTDAIMAAFLLAWSGLEAAMRYKAKKEKLGGAKPTAPTVLVRMLYAAGIFSDKEVSLIDTLFSTRSAIVHGFQPSDVVPECVQSLADIARRLIRDKPKRESIQSPKRRSG